MDIKIADLRHRIDLERFTSAPDGQGGSVITWGLLQSCWAKITPKSGGERVFAQKIQADYDHEIIIRNTLDHLPNKEADRVKFGNRFFQIKSIQYVDERKWWIQILVKEGVAS